jgi:hypothetical protein
MPQTKSPLSKTQSHRTGRAASKQLADEELDRLPAPEHPAAIVHRASHDPGALSPGDALQLQRAVGNRAVGRLLAGAVQRAPVENVSQVTGGDVIQRNGVAARVKQLEDDLKPATVTAVRRWAKGSKKKGHAIWERILQKVTEEEPFWDTVRDHVMLGEDETPPKGYHSTQEADSAHSETVGAKSPGTAGAGAVYKQWTRNTSDDTYDNLKISTFYPDNWPEDKIQAAVLLRTAGAEHQVESHFGLKKEGDTIYPDVQIPNPPEPE